MDQGKQLYLEYRQASEQLGRLREYAETTQQYVDEEIARIVDTCYGRVVDLLTGNRAALDRVARKLLEVETLDAAEFLTLVRAE